MAIMIAITSVIGATAKLTRRFIALINSSSF
jgi:hypothetical protein